MGHPVVHFEVLGKDAGVLQAFYSGLFNWQMDTSNPMNYGTVQREGNTLADGTGIGGGVGPAPEGTEGYVTFYVQVPDIEATLVQVEERGGSRTMGPEEVMPGLTIGMFADPEGHLIGLVQGEVQS